MHSHTGFARYQEVAEAIREQQSLLLHHQHDIESEQDLTEKAENEEARFNECE